MIKHLIQKSIKILLVLMALTVFPASATPAVIIEEVQNTTVSSTIPMNIVLTGAEKGLAGYNITVSLANASLAEIISVNFPGATLTNKGSLPADSVWLKAFYYPAQTGPGDIILATVNVRIDAPGTVKLNANVYLMDDRDGNPYFPGKVSPTASPTVIVTPVIQVNVTPSTQTNVPSVTSTIGNTPETTPGASSTPTVVSTPDETNKKATTAGKTEKGDNSPKTSGFQVILFMICMSVVFVCKKKYS